MSIQWINKGNRNSLQKQRVFFCLDDKYFYKHFINWGLIMRRAAGMVFLSVIIVYSTFCSCVPLAQAVSARGRADHMIPLDVQRAQKEAQAQEQNTKNQNKNGQTPMMLPAGISVRPPDAGYVPGQVLVKFKEGARPSMVLQEEGIKSKSIDRLFSVKPVVAKLKKEYVLEKGPAGWFSFLGKNYKELKDIPEETLFERAYTNLTPQEKGLYQIYKLQLDEGQTVAGAIALLKKSSQVVYAEPDYIEKINTDPVTPDDPLYPDQWAHRNANSAAAWAVATGMPGTVIAVIDTGIDYEHPDLAANMWHNPGEIPGNGIDDDNNGYVDDVHGYDFANNDADPIDDHGHGTHCAGIADAAGNNGVGVAGVSWGCRLMAVKGLDYGGSGSTSWLAACIKYAAENGAKVLSDSWGANRRPFSNVFADAIDYAYAKNCVVVFAAGNSWDDVAFTFPQNYYKVITVAATDSDDLGAWFSNYGIKIDVAAPGVNILSSLPPEGELGDPGLYGNLSGTSMACPFVAGLCGLIASAHPDFSNEEIKQAVCSGADDVETPGWDMKTGPGRVNCARSLEIGAPCTAVITAPAMNDLVNNLVTITGTASGAAFDHYILEYATETGGEVVWAQFGEPCYAQKRAEVLGEFDTTMCAAGKTSGYIRLTVFDTYGGKYLNTIRVAVDNMSIINPPTHQIFRSGEVIEITGTMAAYHFSRYQVEYRRKDLPDAAWMNTGIMLTDGGMHAVENGVLARLDTAGLPESNFEMRLQVFRTTGAVNTIIKDAILVSPYLKPGFPIRFPMDSRQWHMSHNRIMSRKITYLVSDIDKDGVQEIVVCVSGLPGKVYAYKPDGSLCPGWPIEIKPRGAASSCITFSVYPVCADLDRDPQGKEEILIPYTEFQFFEGAGVWLPGASAICRDVLAFHHDGTPYAAWNFDQIDTMKRDFLGDAIAVADLDRDGFPEVLIAGEKFYALFITDHTGKTLKTLRDDVLSGHAYFGSDSALVMAVGNLDDDAELEIVLRGGAYTDAAGAWHMQTTALKLDGSTLPGVWPVDLFHNGQLILGDIDNDRKDEIMMVGTGGTYGLNILRGDGRKYDGTPSQPALWPQQTDIPTRSSEMIPFDWNNDGKLEILGNSSIFLHTGDVAKEFTVYGSAYPLAVSYTHLTLPTNREV